jgi:hypothetical protein
VLTMHRQTKEVMELESGATGKLCSNSTSASGEEDDLQTQVTAKDTVLISVQEYDRNGNIVTSKVTEGAQLYSYDLSTGS